MKSIKSKIHWFLTDETVNERLVNSGLVLSAAGWVLLGWSLLKVIGQ